MHVCARCGKEIVLGGRVMRESICPNCRAYLHSCVNCKFYSPGRHNDCSEPQAEQVRDKRTANFCDFFVFRETDTRNEGPRNTKDDARKRFDSLFGG